MYEAQMVGAPERHEMSGTSCFDAVSLCQHEISAGEFTEK